MSQKLSNNEKEKSFQEQLEDLAVSNRYPFHMPGHKRQMDGIGNPYKYDITEIEGFDDLADPKGMIAKLIDDLREIYDAGAAYLSLNGSTGSNLVGFFAATNQHDEVLIAENCHRSVFHAAEIRQCKVNILPLKKAETDFRYSEKGIPEGADPKTVEEALICHPDVTTVVITSPTYEGIVSDIASIAEIVHKHHARLFVDAAHGAHFAFGNYYLREYEESMESEIGRKRYFPEDPIALGADAMTVSLHKTLPMPGQTSLLLLPKQGGLDRKQIEIYWQIFMTSSPSYLLMAMISNGLKWLEENGQKAFLSYYRRLEDYYLATRNLDHFQILYRSDLDPGKIDIIPKSMGNPKIKDGFALAECLLKKYKIDVELAADDHIIAMTSVMDTDEGFARLLAALKEMDRI